jgi:hypothetical protein
MGESTASNVSRHSRAARCSRSSNSARSVVSNATPVVPDLAAAVAVRVDRDEKVRRSSSLTADALAAKRIFVSVAQLAGIVSGEQLSAAGSFRSTR